MDYYEIWQASYDEDAAFEQARDDRAGFNDPERWERDLQ